MNYFIHSEVMEAGEGLKYSIFRQWNDIELVVLSYLALEQKEEQQRSCSKSNNSQADKSCFDRKGEFLFQVDTMSFRTSINY